jgi:hypothetical protein
MATKRERITVEDVAADPTNAYEVTVHGDVAIESLKIVDSWVAVQYANGGSSAGAPKHWAAYVRITEEADTPTPVASVAAIVGRNLNRCCSTIVTMHGFEHMRGEAVGRMRGDDGDWFIRVHWVANFASPARYEKEKDLMVIGTGSIIAFPDND